MTVATTAVTGGRRVADGVEGVEVDVDMDADEDMDVDNAIS
jgi:hypothetical protein